MTLAKNQQTSEQLHPQPFMINFISIIVFLAAGALANRKNWLPKQASHWLNSYVIWICLPAVVLTKVPSLSIDLTLLPVIFTAWAMVGLGVIFALLLARYFHLDRATTGCLMLVIGFGNTSFFGLPMLLALVGPTAVPVAIVYDQLGSFLTLAIVGNFILAHYGAESADVSDSSNGNDTGDEAKRNQTRSKAAHIIQRVVTFPPFVSLIVAAIFGTEWIEDWVLVVLQWVAVTLTPVTMFLVGLYLQFRIQQSDRRLLTVALASKLLVAPMIVGLAFAAFGFNGLPATVALLESAMPPMVTASVMAIHAGLAPRLAAAAVGYGLFFSLITLPLWRMFCWLVF